MRPPMQTPPCRSRPPPGWPALALAALATFTAALAATLPARAQQPTLEQAAASLPGSSRCRSLSDSDLSQLTLIGALEHVVCRSPLLSQALLLVDEQQAGVALAQTAWRPRVSANAEFAANRIPSSNSGSGSLGSSLTGSLGMSWVVYDFGLRSANLRQSRYQLDSARAAQQTAALTAVNDALRLYVEAAAALARLQALQETEIVARQSLAAAQAKYEAQVVSLAEKLQAQTALAQATLDRVRADGAWQTARGLLAVAMGFAVDQAITLAPPSSAFPAISLTGSPAAWIEESKRQHPRVRSAQADVLALRSRLDSLRSEGKGNVSISGGVGSTKDLATPGAKLERSLSGYVIATIPLFNQAEMQAREMQVVSQIESRQSGLTQVERDIEADLWQSIRLMESEAENLKASKMLLRAAAQSYEITFGRYKSGVGSILELLATQTALSNARSQLTQAQLSHAQARLRLEVASGRILISK